MSELRLADAFPPASSPRSHPGILTAVGGYTFVYAKGYSYLTNDPAACANCHSAIEGPDPGRNRLSCIRCHSTVGHLE